METLVPVLRRRRFQGLLASLSTICFCAWNLAVASIIFHQNLLWVTPSSCSRLSTRHLTSDIRHGLEPVAPVQVYGLKHSMLFGNLGLLFNLPSFEYSEASHFLQG